MSSEREIKPHTQYVVLGGYFYNDGSQRIMRVVSTGYNVSRDRTVDVFAANAVTGDQMIGVVARQYFGIEVDDVE